MRYRYTNQHSVTYHKSTYSFEPVNVFHQPAANVSCLAVMFVTFGSLCIVPLEWAATLDLSQLFFCHIFGLPGAIC